MSFLSKKIQTVYPTYTITLSYNKSNCTQCLSRIKDPVSWLTVLLRIVLFSSTVSDHRLVTTSRFACNVSWSRTNKDKWITAFFVFFLCKTWTVYWKQCSFFCVFQMMFRSILCCVFFLLKTSVRELWSLISEKINSVGCGLRQKMSPDPSLVNPHHVILQHATWSEKSLFSRRSVLQKK